MKKKNRFNKYIREQSYRQSSPVKWLDVTHTLHISGKIVGKKVRRFYGTRSEGSTSTPRDLAMQMVFNKGIFGRKSHREYNIFNAIARQLPNATTEQIDLAWQEVFLNKKEIIEKIFNEQNQLSNKWMKANDLLKMEAEMLINHFAKSPNAVKYSYLYYLVKKCYNFDYAEMQKDIEQNTPQAAIDWFNSLDKDEN
jgi:hypothetical protein